MKKSNEKKNDIKITLGIVAIFVFGLFIGYQLNFGGIASIQGYLFNSIGYATTSNATNSNATNSNATNSNATNSNATNSNATNSNATNSNATNSNVVVDPTYNVLFLNSFSVDSTSAKAGDRVSISISTSGAPAIGGSVIFKSTSSGASFTSTINSISSNPYIVVPNSTIATSYTVTDVLITARNSDGSTLSKQFSTVGGNGTTKFSFNSPLTIVANSTDSDSAQKSTLSSISLGSTSARAGEEVYVNVKTNGSLTNLKLGFTGPKNNLLTVYVKSLDKNPYFQIPSSTISGSYKLVSATLESNGGSIIYDINGTSGTEKFDFTSVLEISGSNDNSYVYNNEDITSDIITELYNLDSGVEITINADSNTIINSELFNAIKGRNKKLIINYKDNQIVFNGQDINSPKAIDVSITVGQIKDNSDIVKTLGNGSIYVYFYNESDDNFCEIADGIKKTSDGYYEFNVTHHSDYILVNEQLDSSLVVKVDNTVSFQKSNKIYILLIVIGLVVIGAVIGVIVVQKKKAKGNGNISKKPSSDSL